MAVELGAAMLSLKLGGAVVSLLKVGGAMLSVEMGKQRKAEELKAWSELSLMLMAILAVRLARTTSRASNASTPLVNAVEKLVPMDSAGTSRLSS